MPEFTPGRMAFPGRVLPANEWPLFIDLAPMVFCKITASRGYLKMPPSLLYKNGNPLMGKVPSYIFEFFFGTGSVYLESEIPAAF